MSQRDIAEQVKELYDVEISPELVTKITEKTMPEVTAWQSRPLEAVYPFIFMDAIHYKVKEDHRYVTKAAYVVLGITMDGRKDILGVWIGEHEGSKLGLNVLNGLKSRGIMDMYLFCTDGLCGMMEAIQAVYPGSRLQHCIVHQIRSSTRFASWRDIKQVTADLKKIYTSVTLDEAEGYLLQFAEKWWKQYPSCVKNWEERGGQGIQPVGRSAFAAPVLTLSNIAYTAFYGVPIQGQPPVLPVEMKRERLNMLSALSRQGDIRFMLYEDSMNWQRLIRLMESLILVSKQKVFLILDNLNVHHGKLAVSWQEKHKDKIEVFFLPPYAPEYNPDEYLTHALKISVHSGQQLYTREDLCHKIHSFMRKLQHRPALVSRLFLHPTISYLYVRK